MADEFRPDKIGLLVATTHLPNLVQVIVDPDRPRAWKVGGGKRVVDYLVKERKFTAVVAVGNETTVLAP
jgi:hypothetical protein